jgi:hypothetical protein
MNWKNLISQNVGQEQLPLVSTFIKAETITLKSPLDIFYEESIEILRETPIDLDGNNWQGCTNVVAIVSLTENYFRSILGKILNICEETRKHAAEQQMNFGSVLWHPNEIITRGAFEHISFSDSKKIIDITKKYVGIDLIKTDLIPILEEFKKICEIRHGIVHSGRYMAGKNALILDIPSTSNLIKINIGYGQLQSIAAICTTLVISYNKIMFEFICKRWATTWRQSPSWDSSIENKRFKEIWDIFYSTIDKKNGTINKDGSLSKCRNLIKKEFNLI